MSDRISAIKAAIEASGGIDTNALESLIGQEMAERAARDAPRPMARPSRPRVDNTSDDRQMRRMANYAAPAAPTRSMAAPADRMTAAIDSEVGSTSDLAALIEALRAPKGDTHTETYSQEDPMFATNHRFNPQGVESVAPELDLAMLAIPGAAAMVPKIAQMASRRGGLSAASRIEPTIAAAKPTNPYGMNVQSKLNTTADNMMRSADPAVSARGSELADRAYSLRGDPRQMSLPGMGSGTQLSDDQAYAMLKEYGMGSMPRPKTAMRGQGELDLSRMRQEMPTPIPGRGGPDGLYSAAPGASADELGFLNHGLPTPDTSFRGRLQGRGAQYTGRDSGQPPIPMSERPTAIRGGGPEGLHPNAPGLDILETLGQDVRVMGRPRDPQAEMQRIAAEIDRILGRRPAKGKPQFTNMSPQGRMHTGNPPRHPMATGGLARYSR
jgi:hypothetical protein